MNRKNSKMSREMEEAEAKPILDDLFASEEEELAGQSEAWKYTFAFVESMAVRSVVLLGIPDMIACHGSNATLSLSEIVAGLPSESPDAQCLFRILRFLVAKNFFSAHIVENGDGSHETRYGLTAVSKWMVKRREPSMVPMLLFHNHSASLATWLHLNDCVVEGGSAFEKANGAAVQNYAPAHPDYNDLINKTRVCNTKNVMDSVLSKYQDFDGLNSLVDVGGCLGTAVAEIVRAYPHIKGFNFDLPHVVATAPHLPGVEHVGGNMFESIPSADAVFMKSIMHGWSDEDCIKILNNCRRAIPEKGKVIIVDIVLGSKDNGVDPCIGHAFDLFMAAFTSAGKERTEQEWKNLLRAGGFTRCNIINVPGLYSVVEAFPC